jgi:hypothetical protein
MNTRIIVDSEDISNNAVTGTKILNGAVTETKIADGSISTGKILDYNVTATKLTVDGSMNAFVGARIAALQSAGGVGQLVFGIPTIGGTWTYGQTISGANLGRNGVGASSTSGSGTMGSGTYMCLGHASGTTLTATLWIRII